MCNKEWLGSFFIESTLSCMCAEGLLFASIRRSEECFVVLREESMTDMKEEYL